MSPALVESLKELGRLVVLAGLAAAVGYGTTKLANLDPNSVWVLVGTPLLRAVDKWVHESDKTKLNGLVPF